MNILEVQNLQVHYGVIEALKGISFSVQEGEIFTLVGSNGAGKTTTLWALSNLLPKSTGQVFFKGIDHTKTASHLLPKEGLVHVPEGRRVFHHLSVADNLKLGAYHRKRSPKIQQDLDYVYDLFPRLEERRKQNAGSLSGGEQQMLAIGRALMAEPKVLLLDEPSMGLAPLMVQEIFRIIQRINAEGTTILLVEQNANLALEISNQACVLETGQIVLAGSAKEIAQNKRIQEVYLGVS